MVTASGVTPARARAAPRGVTTRLSAGRTWELSMRVPSRPVAPHRRTDLHCRAPNAAVVDQTGAPDVALWGRMAPPPEPADEARTVSYTHLRAHETRHD